MTALDLTAIHASREASLVQVHVSEMARQSSMQRFSQSVSLFLQKSQSRPPCALAGINLRRSILDSSRRLIQAPRLVSETMNEQIKVSSAAITGLE